MTPKEKAKEMYQSISVCYSYDKHFRARTFCINVCNQILSYKNRDENFYNFYRQVKTEVIKLNK